MASGLRPPGSAHSYSARHRLTIGTNQELLLKIISSDLYCRTFLFNFMIMKIGIYVYPRISIQVHISPLFSLAHLGDGKTLGIPLPPLDRQVY